ncbi:hypothetical protein IAT40_000939 [Kwoniella sp. CBS 6097]
MAAVAAFNPNNDNNTNTNNQEIARAASPARSEHLLHNDDGIVTAHRYSDPNADVVLVSIEGKHFRVHSYVLKANSSWFRDQLQHHHHREINVDVPSKLLKKLLDGMHMLSLPAEFVWAWRHRFFEACDKYHLEFVVERALLSLLDVIDKDPWAVFCVASKRQCYGLAKAALRAMAFEHKGHGEKPMIDRLTPELAAQVAMPYLLGLFHAALKWNQQALADQEKAGPKKEIDWRFIAINFTPINK